MTKHIWLPKKMVKDHLTRREVLVYSIIKYSIFCIFASAYVLFFVLKVVEPEYWHAVPLMLLGVPAWIFGWALKMDARVIHGVLWLRKGAKGGQ